VLRPGCVYGGKQSLVADWFAAAEQRKPLQVVGDGNNRWAMVNLHDLTDCYIRIIDQRATGIFHGTDDTHATINDCARAVAPSGKIEHTKAEGPLGLALTLDQNVRRLERFVASHPAPQTHFVVGRRAMAQWRAALQPTN
jgi:nucleoside-diphosphate-sugar epimerase